MRTHPRHLLGSAILFLALIAAAGQAAAEAPRADGPASGTLSAPAKRVRDAVLGRFRALPVQSGIVLVPQARIEGVDNIELRNGTIAINGHPVTGGEVRQRLGAVGDAVLELSYFDLVQQRQMLIPGADDARPAAPAVAAPPEPPAPAVSPEPPEPPEPEVSVPDRTIRRRVESRVRIGGDVTVDADEQVDGPVVAVLGSVTVNGRVRDDVVAVGGSVRLGPLAEVRGDVTAVGGNVDRDAGARVGGRVNDVRFSVPPVHIRPRWDVQWMPWFDSGPWRVVRLLGSVLRMVIFTLMTMLCLLLVPRAVERVETAVRTQPWKSAIVGLLAQLFFVPLTIIVVVVLAVSIIGIPLLALVPFGILLFFLALLLGFTGAAMGVARLGQRRFSWTAPAAFSALVVGLVMIWGVTVLGRLVAFGGGPLAVVGGVLVFTGFAIEYAAWTLGLGGALITRFGRVGPLSAAPYEPPVYDPPAYDPPYQPRRSEPAPGAPPPDVPPLPRE